MEILCSCRSNRYVVLFLLHYTIPSCNFVRYWSKRNIRETFRWSFRAPGVSWMCLRVLSSLFLLRYINDIKLKAGLAFLWPLHIPWSYLYVHFSSFPGQINGIILKGVLKFLGTFFFFSNKRLSSASIFSSRGPSKGDSALRYCLAWQCFLQGTDLFLRSQVHVVFLKSNRGARVTRAQ